MSELPPTPVSPDPYLERHPDATPRLNAALARAQGMFEAAKKESENPAFSRPGKKSTYADISSVLDAVRAALSANEIAYPQTTVCNPDGVEVTTHLLHASGESMRSSFWVPIVKKDPQGYGAACTYARRFGLQAILNVATEDDDGNAASGIDNAPTPEEIADGQKKMAARAEREAGIKKIVVAYAALGISQDALEAKLGKSLAALTDAEWIALRADYAKAAAKKPDADEAARLEVQRQAEAALEKPINFANCIDRIRLATTEADCTLIEAEFVGLRPAPMPGEIKAMARAAKDRRNIIADKNRPKPEPRTDDIPF